MIGYLASARICAARSMPVFDRGRLTVDQATGPLVDVVVEEPGLAQHAGPLGFDDVVVLDRQIDVVAHAAAERAGGVLDDFERVERIGGWLLSDAHAGVKLPVRRGAELDWDGRLPADPSLWQPGYGIARVGRRVSARRDGSPPRNSAGPVCAVHLPRL